MYLDSHRYTRKAPPQPWNLMFSPLFLSQHRQWTVSRWVLPLLQKPAEEVADIGVMALGLCGEVAEVADVIEQWAASGICDTPNLTKELGDVFFYWSRLSERFALSSEGLPLLTTPEDTCRGCAAKKPPVLEALRLTRAAGLASESVKKYLRDAELNQAKLTSGMHDLFRAWLDVCQAAGLDPIQVVTANREKVEGRVARGTQRGSGDNR